ncbi:hypothetical protein GCM10007858_11890 [Bradyrhizobium liaoningense]|nr:hypothetical protein GCM10007858_11890 [Bradyrhizobium liaoningense]
MAGGGKVGERTYMEQQSTFNNCLRFSKPLERAIASTLELCGKLGDDGMR